MAFMFLGVIVMLNVLIAIVSDSYDNAQARSRHLFLRSRLELAAELVLVMPRWLLRDAGYAPCRGDMLALLLQTHESRKTGTLRHVGGPLHFVSVHDGYGGAGALLLIGAATIFLPLALLYAALCLIARRLAGHSTVAASLNPEALLATPDAHSDDPDEWLGRVGEMQRVVKAEAAKLAAEQRAAHERHSALEKKVDAILELLHTGGEADDRVRPLVV